VGEAEGTQNTKIIGQQSDDELKNVSLFHVDRTPTLPRIIMNITQIFYQNHDVGSTSTIIEGEEIEKLNS
jgi:hypothetical protein